VHANVLLAIIEFLYIGQVRHREHIHILTLELCMLLTQAHVEFGELGMIYAASRAMEFEHLTVTVTHHLIDYLTVDVRVHLPCIMQYNTSL
jgi:hypothetical protein